MINNAITSFFLNMLNSMLTTFGNTISSIYKLSVVIFNVPIVINGIHYAQTLAFTILVLKSLNEAFQTYILYQNGDGDADPAGLLVRTAQAVAVIATLPWIVTQVFTFGSKIADDVAGLSTGQPGSLMNNYLKVVGGFEGIVVIIVAILMVIMMLIVGIQATIRGAELALMAIIGPIMALNLTSSNRNIWSSWFKQLLIVCATQGLQILMIQGGLSLISTQAFPLGMFFAFGWLWVTIKTPKFIQQFAYSTGFTATVGGTAKQAGLMVLSRTFMASR